MKKTMKTLLALMAGTLAFSACSDEDAILNENCKIHEEGNPNNVDLTYSNNPNEKGDGIDKPTDEEKDEVTGTTPKDWTITYTTKVVIKKKAKVQQHTPTPSTPRLEI